MAFTPKNVLAYSAAYAGALAGMAAGSGVLTDPVSTDPQYATTAIIAGAFAQAFDTSWNNAATLSINEQIAITSVVQQNFAQRQIGNITNPVLALPSNWTVMASGCVALVLSGDIFLATQGISVITPLTSSLVLHVNPLSVPSGSSTAGGSDASSTDGSAGKPFATCQGLYARWQLLTGQSRPYFAHGILTTQQTQIRVLIDGPLPASDPWTRLLDVICPWNGSLIIDFSPAATPIASGTITARAQALNLALFPAASEVETLDQPTAGFTLGQLLLLDTTVNGTAWPYRSGANCQVAGANNLEISQPITTPTATTAPLWPSVPTGKTIANGDSYQLLQLASCFAGGADVEFSEGGSLGIPVNAPFAVVFRPGTQDGGSIHAGGYSATVSIVEGSFSANGGLMRIGHGVSLFNCRGQFVFEGLDHYWIGGVAIGKCGINSGNLTIDGNLVLDQCPIVVNGGGGGGATVNSAYFRVATAGTPCLQVAADQSVGLGSGAYSGRIGYFSATPTFKIQSFQNSTIGYSVFTNIFGALTGTLFPGDYPFDAGVFSFAGATNGIKDPYTGACMGGNIAGFQVYPVTQPTEGVDTTGGALPAALAAISAGTQVTAYMATTGYRAQVTWSTTILAGAGGATISLQTIVDASTGGSSEAAQTGIVLAANEKKTFARTKRFGGLSVGTHTFDVWMAATAGAASVAANATVVDVIYGNN